MEANDIHQRVTPTSGDAPDETDTVNVEVVTAPATVIRIASLIRRVMDEVGDTTLDDAGRVRLVLLLRNCVSELQRCLDSSLHAELQRLTVDITPTEDVSDGELRIAQVALVGWLEGLVEGIERAWASNQQSAPAVHSQRRRPGGLPPGGTPPSHLVGAANPTNQYL